ncbi:MULTISPECIES: disulfide bond formation protein B [Pseudomonas]|uniref:Disulfide bond formation protein B n=1 Tax=Pseudomonas eucalypticola TaxID=2599595 RepID=A0A7D5GYE4_9PSED|nr:MULTISPECIES: disulfide bond formation protein B [Pseudomonas]QKZ02507.1 disulfide bond formation protein B [Pseudomonas eucalypticola]
MVLASSRSWFFLGFMVSAVVLSTAYYLEWQVGLIPCSLSQVQRLCVAVFGVSSLVAAIHGVSRRGARWYLAGHTLLLCMGLAAALRHLWVQANGEQPKVVCQPGLDYLFASLPWHEVLKTLLLGTPECARVNWTLLDLSVPELSLLALAGLAGVTLLGWLQALR